MIPDVTARRRRFAATAVILFAAAAATAPQLVRGNSCGHDFDFHLVSWFDCLNAWRHGIVYPHWSPSSNYGAGEARFIFYPPLTWMLGAALGAVMPWAMAPIALTFLLLAGTGLATRALARILLAEAPAALAGCAAIFSGYALFTAYERSAFGELAGGFWIPLLLLLVLDRRQASGSTWARASDGSAAMLALVMAGAWLSNAPLGVMASYLLAATAALSSVLDRSWAPLARGAVAAILGIGLSGFYLIPAAYEQRWVDIRQATNDPGEMIQNSFLFGRNGEPALHQHNLELQRVSVIALGMIGAALLGALIAWRRRMLPADWRRWLPLALIPVAILLLLIPFSAPVWDAVPKLRFLQFPWRWLVVMEAPMGIFAAGAVWPRETAGRRVRWTVQAICTVLFLGFAAMAGTFFFQPCDDEDAVAPMVNVFRSGAGFEGTDEYAPVDTDNGLVATGLPAACLVSDPETTLGVVDTPGANPDWWVEQHSCEATFTAKRDTRDGRERMAIEAVLPHAGYLILRLRDYPAWRILLNGRPAGKLETREDGLMEFAAPAGPVDVAVDWTTTPDVMAGRWVSMASLALLVAFWGWERQRKARTAPVYDENNAR